MYPAKPHIPLLLMRNLSSLPPEVSEYVVPCVLFVLPVVVLVVLAVDDGREEWNTVHNLLVAGTARGLAQAHGADLLHP